MRGEGERGWGGKGVRGKESYSFSYFSHPSEILHPTGGYYYDTCNNLLATHMISIMEPGLSCLGVTVHAAS